MIQPLKYITLTGPIQHIDRVVEQYLSRYDIHLENAAEHLAGTEGIHAYTGENPYTEAAAKAEFFLGLLRDVPEVYYPIDSERARKVLEAAQQRYDSRSALFMELEEKRDIIAEYIRVLRPFAPMDFELSYLKLFKSIQCVFGRMTLKNFQQFKSFLYDNENILFVEAASDHDYIWGCYFMPAEERQKVNAIFTAFHFEVLPVTAECLDETANGTIAEVIRYWQKKLEKTREKISEMAEESTQEAIGSREELLVACHTIRNLYRIFDIKKYAVRTDRSFYVFTGWMTGEDAYLLERETNDDEWVYLAYSDKPETKDMPPTKLINPPVVRWFEFFTQMYGLPVYSELDPTPFITVAYTLLFGLMFGDVGQGICIALLGLLAYRKYKHPLAGIVSVVGVSAMLFGFLYGSIFGIEELLPALWRRPAEDMMGMLMFAVILGAGIIVCSMILNMVNAVRQKQWGNLLVSPNGAAGLVFYGGVLGMALAVMNGFELKWWVIAAACMPLLCIAFREFITEKIEKHRHDSDEPVVKEGLGIRIFQTALELFEVLLSYITNTVSFVRVGAFALSHAGMMSVVMMLASSADGSHNPLVLIAGNILVIAVEGLLVGIQVLRLNFYEIFSRFYNGSGREFKGLTDTRRRT